MRRIIRRGIGITFTAALLACSQDGRAATEPQKPAAAPAGASGAPLFREAAQQSAPQQAEAAVPAQGSLAPLIEKIKGAVVNISTTTTVTVSYTHLTLPTNSRV